MSDIHTRKKHAYLIIAHNEFRILEKLILALDDDRSDIFIHIDKRVKSFNYEHFQSLPSKSKVYFIKNPIACYWGGENLIESEFLLLEDAVKNNYEYYHLLSGIDMPIKTQDEINAFFDKNKGSNYFDYSNVKSLTKDIPDRFRYYYFFQRLCKKWRGEKNIFKVGSRLFFRIVQSALVLIQKIFGIDRTKSCDAEFYKGGQWFSITHELASYALSQKPFVKKHFYKGYCTDEIFLQTVAMNSPYKDSVVNDTLREINWDRRSRWGCTPYIYTSDDFEILKSSEKLFARKFSERMDFAIVETLYNHLLGKLE